MDWQSLLACAKALVGSNAFDTVVGGAFGAFFGAWGAQGVISRGQRRQSIVTELNSISAATVLCFSISNAFIAFKRQIVLPLRASWQSVHDAHVNFIYESKLRQAKGPRVFHFKADLESVPFVRTSVDVLERHVFEKTALRGRGLAAADALFRVIDDLTNTVRDRNDLVTEFREASHSPERLLEFYLGTADVDGHVDDRFRANIEALYLHSDDCIFFSRILADDLIEYGNRLRKRLPWRSRFRFPKFLPADWSEPERRGLLPSQDNYQAWLKGFRRRPKRLEALRKRLAAFMRYVVKDA